MLPTTQIKTVEGELVLTSIVTVVFPNSNTEYSYYSDIPDLQKDDFAIVASPYGPTANRQFNDRFHNDALDGYPTVVRVTSTMPTLKQVSKAAKWIIQKIDINKYVARLAIERQVDILKHRIAEEKKAALEALELAKLRELNPTLGVLVDQLAALTGQVLEAKPTTVREHKRAKPRKAKTTKTPKVKVVAMRKGRSVEK
jgi:hypothetical protein